MVTYLILSIKISSSKIGKKRKKKLSKSYNKPYVIVQEFMERVLRNEIKIIFVTFIKSADRNFLIFVQYILPPQYACSIPGASTTQI